MWNTRGHNSLYLGVRDVPMLSLQKPTSCPFLEVWRCPAELIHNRFCLGRPELKSYRYGGGSPPPPPQPNLPHTRCHSNVPAGQASTSHSPSRDVRSHSHTKGWQSEDQSAWRWKIVLCWLPVGSGGSIELAALWSTSN